jgi:hypothetical protein
MFVSNLRFRKYHIIANILKISHLKIPGEKKEDLNFIRFNWRERKMHLEQAGTCIGCEGTVDC